MKTLALISLLALSGCTLAPKYIQPASPVADNWQIASPESETGASLSWQSLLTDPNLQATIRLALDNNRDLRVAVLNIEKARAQYGISRSQILPNIDANLTGNRNQNGESFGANLSLSRYEIDLFGRVRSLNASALESFFARQENQKAVQISLIASVATQWLNMAADQDTLNLTRQTLMTRRDALDIAQGRARIGVLSDLDLNQATTLAEQARADVARLETQLDQDRAALTLLVGASVPTQNLPSGLKADLVAESLPVGLPSDVLLNRPDVLASEHDLKSANANIGAARAAFFPSITLTAATGSSSPDLNGLFDSGTGAWSFSPAISLPIFAGGANRAGLQSAEASRDIALATYEKAIQSAFSEVNSALAVRARIDERLDAQTKATEAAQRSLNLSQARYNSGVDGYLVLLDAQRTLYTSQQALINLQALKSLNLVVLYRALGDETSLN